jgi:ABC-type glycerol-3-phosphate transport system permease component
MAAGAARSAVGPGQRVRARTRDLGRWLTFGITLLLAAVFTFPFFWTVSSSLKDPTEILAFPPLLLPSSPQWQNYVEVWRRVPFSFFLRNTVVVTLVASIGQIVSASLVAYGFSRFRFPGRDVLFLVVVSTLILPSEVTIIPSFLIFRQLNWLDTLLPLIVPWFFGGGAFSIFLLRQFFLTIPIEMDEAAKMDGATSLQVLTSIVVPLSKPAIATVAIFAFLLHWNEFLAPLIYLNSPENFTLSLGIRYFQRQMISGGEVTTQYLLAGAVMMALPCIAVFITMQRHFVEGIVFTGMKG